MIEEGPAECGVCGRDAVEDDLEPRIGTLHLSFPKTSSEGAESG